MAYLDGHLLGVETALPAEPTVCDGVDEVDMAVVERRTQGAAAKVKLAGEDASAVVRLAQSR